MRLPNLNRVMPRRQRGAFGLMAVGVMFLLVICVVVALDSGRLYMQKQNVQRVADMAALDAVAGLNFSGEDSSDDPQVLAEQNAVENNFQPMEGERRIETAMGAIEVVEGINRFNENKPGSALRVRAWHRVPTSLVGNLARLMPNTDIESHVWLMGEAVAQQRQFVAFTAGSSLLTADLSSSPLLKPVLQRLLGSGVNVNVVSAGGLANLGVSLLDLIEADPDIGTVDELLSASVSVAEMANLMIDALDRDDSSNEILALKELAKVRLRDITLAEILTVNTPGTSRESALETLVSVGDLLNAGIFLANKGSAVNLEGVEVDVGSLVTVDLDLSVVEPPQLAVGPPGCIGWSDPPCNSPVGGKYWLTQASTAQLDLDLELSLNVLGLAKLSLALGLEGAKGVAGIEKVGSLSEGGYHVDVGAVTSATDVSVNNIELDLLPLDLGLGTLSSLLTVSIGSSGTSGNKSISDEYDSGYVVWSGKPEDVSLSSGLSAITSLLDELLSNINVTVEHKGILGPLLNPLLSLLGDILNLTLDNVGELSGVLTGELDGITEAVLEPLLKPLLSGLGIGLAEVEVIVIDVDTSGAELVL